jgi:hypothetical protein
VIGRSGLPAARQPWIIATAKAYGGQMSEQLLSALGEAARNPLSFVAYLALVIAWAVVTLRNRRLSTLLRSIDKFPEGERRKVVQAEMNVILPRNITAEQWLQAQWQGHLFIGLLASLAAVVVLAAIAAFAILSARSSDAAAQVKLAEVTVETARPPAPPPGVLSPGKLEVSAVFTSLDDTTGGMSLDFRVSNTGGSDVVVNRVLFTVDDIKQCGYKGFFDFSATYDADISLLKRVGDAGAVPVSQLIAASKADRFQVKVAAKFLGTGVEKVWKLRPTLATNYGDFQADAVVVAQRLLLTTKAPVFPNPNAPDFVGAVPAPANMIGAPSGTRAYILADASVALARL